MRAGVGRADSALPRSIGQPKGRAGPTRAAENVSDGFTSTGDRFEFWFTDSFGNQVGGA